MTDLPARLRTDADKCDYLTAGLMRAAADEIERLRRVPLAALDADTPPTVPQVQALADAMWQLLDDMDINGQCVCLFAKAQARVAYEPFRFTDDNGDDGLDMPLSKAEAILAEI